MSIQSLSSATAQLVARTTSSELTGRSNDTTPSVRPDEVAANNASPTRASSDTASRPEQRLEDVVNEVNEFIKPINNSL